MCVVSLLPSATEIVYALDGDQYVNRPGPRLVDSLEYLAGLIHPDSFETPPADAAQPLSMTPVKL